MALLAEQGSALLVVQTCILCQQRTMGSDNPGSAGNADEIAALRVSILLAQNLRAEDLLLGRTDLVAQRDGLIAKMKQRLGELGEDL
jgi:hypothetical protein